MSTQQHVSSIAEYKRSALLKYCKENGIKKYQLDELSVSNNLHKLGLFYLFFKCIIVFIYKLYVSIYVFVLARISIYYY